jgi:hypothetical protein
MSAARRKKNSDGTAQSRLGQKHVDLDRLVEVMVRMERGDPVPIDPSWLDGVPPLSDSQRRQIKGAFERLRRLQPPLACMAPTEPPCQEPPIGSHSIQRAGPLSVLAEDHHVMVLRYSQSIVERASTYMERTPIANASTFPGLCTAHDRSLFEPIDRHSLREPTSEQLFLLAYRSVLRDFYTARWMARHRQGLFETMIEGPARPGMLEMFLGSLLRIELILPRFARIAEAFARWHRERIHQELCTIIGKHLPVLPFAVGNYIEPRHDGEGQPLDLSADPPPFIVLNVVPSHEGSTVAVSFFEEHRRALESFLAPLRKPAGPLDFADRVWLIALRSCDNVVVGPAAWRAIPERRRARILRFADETRDGPFVPMLPRNVSLSIDGQFVASSSPPTRAQP